MKPFPTIFSESESVLQPESVDPVTAEALQALGSKGFHIQIGITQADVPALQALSVQESIIKYCPRDCTERFKDQETVREWLRKERLVFLLKETSTGELAGIAWTGPGTSPSHLFLLPCQSSHPFLLSFPFPQATGSSHIHLLLPFLIQ